MTAKRVPLSCVGHTRPVLQLAYSGVTPDGIFLASASKDGKPMIRSGETGDWIGTFDGHDGAVWSVDISKNGLCVLTGSADFSAKMFDAATGKELTTLKHPHIVKAVALSEDTNNAVTACGDKRIRLWDLRAKDEGRVIGAHDTIIHRALFCADGSHVLTSDDSGVIKCFKDGNEISSIECKQPVKDLSLLPNGQVLASCGDSIKWLDPAGTRVEHSESVSTPVNTAAFHPSEDYLVWGGEDQTVYLCNQDAVTQDSLSKHFGAVHCVRFSPDGQSFASCSEDGTLLLWPLHPERSYGLWRGADKDKQSEDKE